MGNLKVQFAILGGFAGLLIAGIFFWDGTGDKTITAFGGIAIGAMVGYFLIAILEIIAEVKNNNRLINKMRKLNPIRGKHINDVVSAIGGYTSKSPITITDRNNEQGQIYKFKNKIYEVDIMVGADGICVGIMNEYLNGKKLQ